MVSTMAVSTPGAARRESSDSTSCTPRSAATVVLATSIAAISGALDPLADRLGEAALCAGDVERVARRGGVVAELDQPGDRVHPVGELVLLGAQRVGQRVDAVELAQQPLELGAVA